MTVEACKAGKDVYVEKPACVYVEEGAEDGAGRAQVQARGAGRHHAALRRLLQEGRGDRARAARSATSPSATPTRAALTKQDGWGNPPDSEPPPGLDWDMWLGPGAQGAVQRQSLGRQDRHLPHLPLLLGLRRRRHDGLGRPPDRPHPPVLRRAHAALPSAPWATSSTCSDNVETPDTMLATFHYPKFLSTYESRTCNPLPMFGAGRRHRRSTAPKATLFVNRSGCWVIPNAKSRRPQTCGEEPQR